MDRRRVASAVLALLSCAALGCAAPLLGKLGPQEAADRARPSVERVRGLPFLAPVGAREQTHEERKAELDARLAGSDEEAAEARERGQLELVAYQLFGLLPVHLDMAGAVAQVNTDNLAGYYNSEEKSLTLMRGIDRNGAGGVVGHELVHALQDQHFEIGATRRAPRDNDASMALGALIEGDATLAGFDFGSFRELQAASTADEERRDLIVATLTLNRLSEELERKSPLLLIENKWFRYESGFGFVSSVHADLGWAGVDALYADPPESTEQILYPERYLDRRERPVSIELAAPPEGWRTSYENNLGLFETRLLLQRRGAWFANAVASGWDGDRYAVWEGDGDGELALVWYTVWHGPEEAARFARAYAGALSRLDPERATWGVATEGRVVAVVPSGPPGRVAELLSRVRESRWGPSDDARAASESLVQQLARYPFRMQELDRVREVKVLGGQLLRHRAHENGSRTAVLGGLALQTLSRPERFRVDLAGGLLGLRGDRQRGDRELKLLPALRAYLRDDGAFDLHLLEDPLFARSALRVGRSADLDVLELGFALRWRSEPDRTQLSLPFGLLDYTRTAEQRAFRALHVPFTSIWLVCVGCSAPAVEAQ